MNRKTTKRVPQKYLVYLDSLRESGVTNMYGSSIYVERAFNVSRDRAEEIVAYWMQTFSRRHPK